MRVEGTTSAFSGDWRKPLALGVWLSLICIVLYLGMRDDAKANQASVTAACLLAGLAMVASVTVNLLVHPLPVKKWGRRYRMLGGITTLVMPLAIGLLLTDQHTNTSAGVLSAIFCMGSLCVLVGPEFIRTLPRPRSILPRVAATSEPISRSTEQYIPMTKTAAELLPVVTERASAQGDEVVQWFARRVTEGGEDQIEGNVQVEFAAGQREASAHIPFSPPFAKPPNVSCETLDNADVRATVTTVYPYGARVQVKRSANTDGRLIVEVGFLASADLQQADAA